MEKHNYNNVRTITIIVVLYVLFSAVLLLAQENNAELKHQNAISTLQEGISSQNEGVRKSSIYIAGKNRIKEVTELLCKQFKKETKPEIKYLIAVALFKINTDESINSICNLCKNENNVRFRFIGKEIKAAFRDSTYLTKN